MKPPKRAKITASEWRNASNPGALWNDLSWVGFEGTITDPGFLFFSECFFYLQTGISVLTHFWSPKHLQSWKTRSASAGLGANPLALRVYWVVDFHWPEQTCSGAQLPTIRIRSIPANKRNGAFFFLLFVGWGILSGTVNVLRSKWSWNRTGRWNEVQENIPQDKEAEPWTPAEAFDWAHLDSQSAYVHAISTRGRAFSQNHETESIDVLRRNVVLLLTAPAREQERETSFYVCVSFGVFKWGYQLHKIILPNVAIKMVQPLKTGGLLSIIPTLQHDWSVLFAGGGLCCALACANFLQHAVVVEKGKSTSLEYAVLFSKSSKSK